MFGRGENKPKKGDKMMITVEDVIISVIVKSVKERGEWGSTERNDEPEATEGYWFDVGFSIEA